MPYPVKSDCPLTLQQIRFCEEYLIDGKVGAAAYRAGYSFHTRGEQGTRLLADQRVKDYLATRTKKIMSVTGITPERILQELALIGFSKVGDVLSKDENGKLFLDLDTIDQDKLNGLGLEFTTDANGKVVLGKVKVSPADKAAALINMGKHMGMFKEQVEHSGVLTLEQLVMNSMITIEQPKPLALEDGKSLDVG